MSPNYILRSKINLKLDSKSDPTDVSLILPLASADGSSVYYFYDRSGNGVTGSNTNNINDGTKYGWYEDEVSYNELGDLFNNGSNPTPTQSSGAVYGVDDARTVISPVIAAHPTDLAIMVMF